jgi:hypothetical protein
VIGCYDCQQSRGTKARTVWPVLSDKLLVAKLEDPNKPLCDVLQDVVIESPHYIASELSGF